MMATHPIHLLSENSEVGSGGIFKSRYIGVNIMIYTPNLNEVNSYINDLGFGDISYLGNLTIEKKISIGKNIYLGAWCRLLYASNAASGYFEYEGIIINRDFNYRFSFFGQKKKKIFPINHNIEVFTGLSIVSLTHFMSITQSEGVEYDWLTHNHGNFSYNYIMQNLVLQPRLKLNYQIFNRNFISLDLGYFVEFLGDTEWKSINGNRINDIKDSPKSSLNGMTYSFGLSHRF
jgi:hypothetical protein